MTHVLMTARHPGAFNALLPVYQELQKRCTVDVVAGGVAYERFREVESGTIHTETVGQQDIVSLIRFATRFLTDTQPEVIVTGTASKDYGIDEAVTIAGSVLNIPVVTVQDYWGTLQLPDFHELSLATRYAVMDSEAKRLLIEQHKIPEERIAVTGQPFFDRYLDFPAANVRGNVRQQLGVGDHEKLVVYATQPNSGSIKTLQMLVFGLNHIISDVPVNLAVLVHPRETAETYRELLATYKHGIPLVRTQAFTESDSLIAAADLVTTQYSTVGLQAHYMLAASNDTFRGGIVAYLLLDGSNLGAEVLMNEKGMNTLPPIALGAAFGITGLEELVPKLQKGLFDEHARVLQRASARVHYLPGNATKNVIEEVLHLQNPAA